MVVLEKYSTVECCLIARHKISNGETSRLHLHYAHKREVQKLLANIAKLI